MSRVLSVEETAGRRTGRPGSGRMHVVMDDGCAFTISAGTARRLGIEEDAVLEDRTLEELMKELRAACMRRCGALLGTRDYPEKRMREKLLAYGFPEVLVDEAVEKLRSAGYLDDGRYAQNYVRTHISSRSRLRIRMDLSGRGIPEEEIERAFREVGRETDLEETQREQIRRLLEKKRFDPKTASFADRQKVMAFLCRKGFPQEAVRKMVE